ncbi:uncharacterized protein EDB91DRAFT_1250771 [Suillus paluster]|uniref:uncharacterized protein n=1 Tax=Suillus paluster TaxID=48578 RepID=UPI001B86E67C|nr:uncharacterized protein EDB91DRAFT_1250771 [Suillus paluster]KAG1734947.1 hypothetical protein EDB91DRAFT_1250771 [Suillus paluster]
MDVDPVVPDASEVKFEAAESPIQSEQETVTSVHGPSSSQLPPSSSQINVDDMEQESPAVQKVLNDSTTPASVNKDDAKRRHKAKGTRKASERTSKDPDKGRPHKRARSDRVIVKHEDFYILDANIVIEVDEVLFKLHRSRLVTKSLLFARLLENHDKDIPPNDDVWVETDGEATVYHLCNTTADDLAALLKFDDNPIEYYFEPPPFLVLAPILRAATALRFEWYRAWAARILEQTWSSNLVDLTSERKENAAEVIVLARSCGVNSGMKRALYELARTRRIGLPDDDVSGQPRLKRIGRADERRVALVREFLVTTWSRVAVRIDTFPCLDEKWKASLRDTAKICPQKRAQQATWDIRVHDSGLYTRFLFDPVCGVQALIDIPWEEEEWCSDCIQLRRAAWTMIRQELWNDMDKYIADNE